MRRRCRQARANYWTQITRNGRYLWVVNGVKAPAVTGSSQALTICRALRANVDRLGLRSMLSGLIRVPQGDSRDSCRLCIFVFLRLNAYPRPTGHERCAGGLSARLTPPVPTGNYPLRRRAGAASRFLCDIALSRSCSSATKSSNGNPIASRKSYSSSRSTRVMPRSTLDTSV